MAGIELPIGLAFKKPFRLPRRAEFMVGIGPEVVSVSNPMTRGTFFGGQVVLDLVFWPSRHVGVWVEPSYEFVVRNDSSHSIGCTGGLIVGW